MTMKLQKIYRHTVKGLTPEELDSVTLSEGLVMPNDRRFAVALGSTPVSGASAEWMPKTSFLMLMKNEKLAQLETSFDDATDALTIKRGGNQVARGVLTQKIGRTMIEDFFAAFMKDEARGRPKLVEVAEGHVLSDHNNPVVSIINKASVKDLERIVGKEIDPRRFRGNLLIDGIKAWAEIDLCGKHIKIGDAVLEVTVPIDRCGATNINPVTAERDLNIPKDLQRGYGHIVCGVYARVIKSGHVTSGTDIHIL